MRKKLTAALLPGPSLVVFDNAHGRLDSDALSAIITAGTWSDRLLGRNDREVTIPVRAAVIVTGNNVALSHELAGRSVLVRIDPKTDDRGQRSGFRHPDLEAWTRTQRAHLIWSTLVLAQAWLAARRPLVSIPFGGFESWARTIGGVLDVAGIPGFLANRSQLMESTDDETAHIRGFLAAWWDRHQDHRVTVKTLFEFAQDHVLLIAAKSEQAQLTRLGRFVATLLDRRFNLGNRLVVVVHRDGEFKRSVLWKLDEVDEVDEVRLSDLRVTRTRARGKKAGSDNLVNLTTPAWLDEPHETTPNDGELGM
jgi:putative DNA primase/helicase